METPEKVRVTRWIFRSGSKRRRPLAGCVGIAGDGRKFALDGGHVGGIRVMEGRAIIRWVKQSRNLS